MSEMRPKVFIIVPVHNRKAFTERCLYSLEKQTYPNIKIIVVDDGSSDGTFHLVKTQFPYVTILNAKGDLWWLGCVNLALKHILLQHSNNNNLVLLLNNDLIFNNDLVEILVQTHQQYPEAIIGSVESKEDSPDIIEHGGNLTNWWLAKNIRLNVGRSLIEFPSGHIETVSYVTGRGVLIPIHIFKKIGFYDKRYRHRGDNEFGVRALRHGFKLLVAYDAVVFHIKGDMSDSNRFCYHFSDLYRYLFDERSYSNLKNILLNSFLCTENPLQGASFFLFGITRTLGHFFKNISMPRNRKFLPEKSDKNMK